MQMPIKAVLASAAVAVLAGCASMAGDPGREDIGVSPWAQESTWAPGPAAAQPSTWAHLALPGKQPVHFRYARHQGRAAMAASADASASMVRQKVNVPPAALGRLSFSWMVPQLIAEADLARREADDSPVRIVLAFEGDRSRFSARDAALSELARVVTGEEMPYATLMYVWCNQREAGTVVPNPRTDRIRKIVLESGAGRLNQWLDYERDIAADYRRAFGEEPGALVGIALMTDTDNTRSRTQAWYGPVRLLPGPGAR